MKSLSICVITQQYRSVISGVGAYTQSLVAGLMASGHTITIVAPADQMSLQDAALRFVEVPLPRLSSSQARWISLAWSFATTLAALQRSTTLDLVHFTDARESLFCRWNCPAVGDVHDSYAAEVRTPAYCRRYYDDWLTRWTYYRFVKFCEARTYPRLDAVIANSHYTAKKIATQYAIAPGNLHVCYKTIQQDRWARALQSRAQQAPHPRRVLFVGGNMQRKGLPTLIQAVSMARDAIPDLELWVVGGDKAIEAMKGVCKAAGVDQQVHFWGRKDQEELVDLYAQSDVFVMPSLTEGFGLVFLEAMASGMPIIGSQAGGIAEVVEQGQNGILVPPGDPIELAAALRRLLTDPDLYARLKRVGLETAARFDLQSMMRCTTGVYQSVLGAGV